MAAEREVNADPNKPVVVRTHDMPWEDTGHAGVQRKVLERVNDERKGRETLILRFAPNASLPAEELTERVDLFVIEGSVSDGQGTHSAGAFVRNPPGFRQTLASKEGCVLYLKRRVPIPKRSPERLLVDTADKAKWIPFPHRGADVIHLYRDMHGIETARVGSVYPEKKIPSHDHAMGEETLVLDGCLKDEYGEYGPGTWFRFPIGVPHAPFTEKERCLMLIREGDLVW